MTKGAHTAKIGADIVFQKIENYFPGNFSGSYLFPSYFAFANKTPTTYTQAFPGPGATGATSKPNVNEYAFFLQDSWRVNEKLTLNYGVRYDLFNYAQPPLSNPNPQLLAAGLSTNRIHIDRADYSPRFGLAYSPDQKTVLRGGYGIFYAVTPSIFTGTAHTQNGIQVQTYTFTTPIPPTYRGPSLLPVTYPNVLSSIPAANRTPSLFVFSRDFKNGQTQQWNFNVERQLGRDYSITLGYLGVKGSHLPRARDINLLPVVPATYPIVSTPVSVPTVNIGALTVFRHQGPRPNPAFTRIMLADSGGNSIYHAGFIQFAKRFSRDFQMQASYTWAHAIDDNPDATQVVLGTDDVKSVQDSLQPNLDRGNANSDIRHRVVFSGLWNLSFVPRDGNPVLRAALNGWQISTIATLQGGRVYSSTVGGSNADLNIDGNSRNDRTPGEGRNALRGPRFLNDDVRLSRFFPLGTERVRLQLIGEAFNVTNRANFISLRTTLYNFDGFEFTRLSTFLTPNVGSATADPRILQLAAKIFF